MFYIFVVSSLVYLDFTPSSKLYSTYYFLYNTFYLQVAVKHRFSKWNFFWHTGPMKSERANALRNLINVDHERKWQARQKDQTNEHVTQKCDDAAHTLSQSFHLTLFFGYFWTTNVTTVARVRSWVIIIILMMKLIKKYEKAQSYTDGTLFGVTQWYKIEKKWPKNEYFNNDIVCLFLKNHLLLLIVFNKIKILRNNSFSQTPRNN